MCLPVESRQRIREKKMRSKKLLWLALLLSLGLARDVLAQAVQQWTTTILAMDTSPSPRPDGLLWVQQQEPKKEIVLQFDLNALPPGFDPNNLVRCTLRLVADN